MNIKDKTRYLKTYFHIEAGYVWGEGMDEAAYLCFEDDVRAIMHKLGFVIQPKSTRRASLRATRGLENLYCHPMNFSGFVKEDSIAEIEETLKNAETFKLRYSQTWDTAYNISADEYLAEMKKQEAPLRESILTAFETKRRHLYKYKDFSAIKPVVPSLNKDLDELHTEFIEELFSNLLEEGWIVSIKSEHGTVYRTLNKTETKEKLKKRA